MEMGVLYSSKYALAYLISRQNFNAKEINHDIVTGQDIARGVRVMLMWWVPGQYQQRSLKVFYKR